MNEHFSRGRGRPRRADIYRQLAIQITELRERLGGLPSPVEAEAAGIWYEEGSIVRQSVRTGSRIPNGS